MTRDGRDTRGIRDDGEDRAELAYHRRRADAATDGRIDRLSRKVDDLDSKVDALSVRVAVIAAILSGVTVLANIVGPIIAIKILSP